MSQHILLAILIIIRVFSYAQKPVRIDTIHIADEKFHHVIKFRLQDFYGLNDKEELKQVICFVNADNLRNYSSKHNEMLFAPNIFTKQNLEKFETDFTNYLNNEFKYKDTLVVMHLL